MGNWIPSWVVVSNIFDFHLYLGKIPILTNIFQMGWNQQLASLVRRKKGHFLAQKSFEPPKCAARELPKESAASSTSSPQKHSRQKAHIAGKTFW